MTTEQEIAELKRKVNDQGNQIKRLSETLALFFEKEAKRARSNARRQANVSQIEVGQADFFDTLGEGLKASG